MTKSAIKSKTIIFGILTVAVGVAGLFGFADYQPSTNVDNYGEILYGIIVVFLRFRTNNAVSLR